MTSGSNFQPAAPVRTNTADSHSSSEMSAPTSPASPASTTSRAASDFFAAMTARVRGRSRSRSRGASRKRSKSPVVLPPSHMAQTAQPRQHASATWPPAPTRPSLGSNNRRSTSGSDMWRGRHSNEWLFGGWSATETAKDLLNRRK
ncbi:hypothetical protein ACEQ8H_003417 [Pleosporales sp. CAS-2024a]